MSLEKLCAGAGKAIRKIVHEIDDDMALVLEEVVSATAKLKALEANPTVEAIMEAFPIGSKLEHWAEVALEGIYKATLTGKTVADKLKEVLDAAPSEFAKNMALSKIASVTTSVGDGFRKSESLYDSATQIKIETAKAK